jgi:hypothetical protein
LRIYRIGKGVLDLAVGRTFAEMLLSAIDSDTYPVSLVQMLCHLATSATVNGEVLSVAPHACKTDTDYANN